MGCLGKDAQIANLEAIFWVFQFMNLGNKLRQRLGMGRLKDNLA